MIKLSWHKLREEEKVVLPCGLNFAIASNHIPKQQILGMLEPGIQSPPVNKANLILNYQYPKSKTKIATKLNLI